MTGKCIVVLLITMWIAPAFLAIAQNTDQKLIRVRPSYSEETQAPRAVPHPNEPQAPTPRQQMYVFWILGHVLSYPIDTAESYISDWIGRWRHEPVATPASAPAGPSPFDSLRTGQIAPAAPARTASGQ
jgi:hypothetical protein